MAGVNRNVMKKGKAKAKAKAEPTAEPNKTPQQRAQSCMYRLKALAKRGHDKPLQHYGALTSNVEKQNFHVHGVGFAWRFLR